MNFVWADSGFVCRLCNILEAPFSSHASGMFFHATQCCWKEGIPIIGSTGVILKCCFARSLLPYAADLSMLDESSHDSTRLCHLEDQTWDFRGLPKTTWDTWAEHFWAVHQVSLKCLKMLVSAYSKALAKTFVVLGLLILSVSWLIVISVYFWLCRPDRISYYTCGND